MKKILIITYYWPPSGGAGVQRWLKMSQYLRDLGFDLTVLTVDESTAMYPQQDASLEEEASGLNVVKTKALSLSKFLKKKKSIPFGGFVSEKRPSLKTRLMLWVRGNLIFPDPRVLWNFSAYRKAKNLIIKNNISTVITSSPPHSTQLIGLKLKQFFGEKINWITDFRDPLTDIYYFDQLGIGAKMLKKHKHYEKLILQKANSVLSVGPELVTMLQDKVIDAEKNKFYSIPNGYDERDFSDLIVPDVEVADLTYTGSLGDKYDLNGFITALKLVPKGFFFRFIGNIHPKWKQKIEQDLDGYVKMEWLQELSHKDALGYLFKSKTQLLVIPRVEQNDCIITGKLFEYLRSHKRVLGIGPVNGDAAKILRECKSGAMFNYDDSESIAKFLNETQIENLADLELIRQHSRKDLTKKLSHLIQ